MKISSKKTIKHKQPHCSNVHFVPVVIPAKAGIQKNRVRIKEEDSKLPKGWKRMKLGNICEIQVGGTPNRSVDTYWNGTIPWVGSTACKDKSIINAKEFITKEGLSNSPAKVLKKSTTLIALVGATIGKTGFLKFECATNQNIAGLYPKDTEELDPVYLYLTAQKLYPVFLYLGNKQFQIANLSFVKVQKILLPPLSEQKAIVSVLEIWDKAIEQTEQLISAKEKQFKWLLKKLISDQQQNPTWQKVKLDEVLDYEQPTQYIVDSTQYDDQYDIPVLTAGKSFIIGYTNEKAGIFSRDQLPVIIFDDFTTSKQLVTFPFKVKSSAMKILLAKMDTADIHFIFYSMKNINFQAKAHKRHWISQYSKITISIPSLSEQNKIAHILHTAQKEIELLKKTMEQYRIQKKGLMQKLLTGKWRLKI